ncbi:MAG: hypothetical protein ACI4EV_02155 [Lachnospiraceae bacterium]
MYNTSVEAANIIDQNGGRKFQARVKIDGEYYYGIREAFITKNTENDVRFGTTISKIVNIKMDNINKIIYDQEVELEFGIIIGNAVEYIPMGKYKAEKPIIDGTVITFKGSDRMGNTNGLYVSTLNYPQDMSNVLEEVCDICGIPWVKDTTISGRLQNKPTGYTHREIIGFIAAFNGKNAYIDRTGSLKLEWYISANKDYGAAKVYFWKKEESEFRVNSISCNIDKENSIKKGMGAGITYDNPFDDENNVEVLYNQYKGFCYHTGEVTIAGDPRIDDWDIINIKLDEDYIVPAMYLQHKYDGGIVTTIKSVGNNSEKEKNYQGPINKAIDRIYTDIIHVNSVLSGKVDTEELNATNAKIVNIDSDVARINTMMFGSATGKNIVTEFANAVIAVLGTAQIKSSQIMDLDVSKLNSGEINTALIRLIGEDGRLSIVGNNIILKDLNDVVRVKIGYINETDGYDFNLFDKSGNLMFSAAGIEESAIQKAIIDNESIKKDANISAAKLDIASLFDAINNDGSHSLKSSKIFLDEKNQSLEVAFNTLSEQATSTDNNLSNYQNAIQKTLEDIQDEIDGVIESYSDSYAPALTNYPASEWTTSEQRQKHIGDLFYDTATGYQYRFVKDGATWKWQQIKDTDITKALQDAEAAQTTANAKRRVFVVQPVPPYDIGDLWSDGIDLKRCKMAKAAGTTFSSNDWEKATHYTDDTKANEVDVKVNQLADTVTAQGTELSIVQGQIGSKIWQSDITTAVNSVQVGGRNLARKGCFAQWSTSTTIDDSNFVSSGAVDFDRNNTTNGGPIIDRYVEYQDSEPYIISFKIQFDTAAVNKLYVWSYVGFTEGKIFIDGIESGGFNTNCEYPNDMGWHRVIISFIGKYMSADDAASTATAKRIILQPNKSTSEAYMAHIKEYKIENGNKQTGWSPAPEDRESQYSSLAAKYTEINQTVDSLEAVAANVNINNMIPFPYYYCNAKFPGLIQKYDGYDEWNINGLTFRINDDGTVVVSGAATANVNFYCSHITNSGLIIPFGIYTLSGCPEGGSIGSYYMWANYTDGSGNTVSLGIDTGNGVSGNIPEGIKGLGIYITIIKETVVDGLIFKPMMNYGNRPMPYVEYSRSYQSIYSLARQAADGFKWLVKGQNQSEFTITDEAISAIAKIIKITGDMIVDGGIKAKQVDFDDVFSQNINVTGSIKGNDIQVNGGNIGGWKVDAGGHMYKKTYRDDSTGRHYYSVVFQSDGSIVYYDITQEQYNSAAITSNSVKYALNNGGAALFNNIAANGGAIGNVSIDTEGLVTGNVALKRGMITISNIGIPSNPNITKVQIDAAGFRFIDKDGNVEQTCVWKRIYDLY